MPRAVAPVDVSSVEDVDVGMGTPVGGWRLYNARSEWFQFQFGGVYYYIPPDLGGTTDEHPVKDLANGHPQPVVCDGILRVDDRVGYVYQTSASGGPTSIRTGNRKVYETAREIVRAIVRMYGDRGITFLTGDQKSDEARKNQARNAYLSKQVEHDIYIVNTWDEEIQKWKKRPQNQGQPMPTPPEPVRLARERLDLRDAQRRGLRPSYKYVCQSCASYATDDEPKFKLHMAVNHGQGNISQEARVAVQAAQVEPGQPKRRGRPPKSAQPQA